MRVVGGSSTLYDTTTQGPNFDRKGLVYLVNGTTGAESVVYHSTGIPDGSYPESQMDRDASANLYGTTAFWRIDRQHLRQFRPWHGVRALA